MTPVNRFFRSALFPLIVIVLLVYLASQTLIPRKTPRTRSLLGVHQAGRGGERAGGEVHADAQPDRGTLVGGDKVKVNYLNDLSAFEVEKLLKKRTSPTTPRARGRRGGATC